jgi:stearoyl-CoA desaturase (Delta-9 desaturase)
MALRYRLNISEWTSFSGTTVRITLILMHAALISVFIFPPTLTDIILFLSFYLATGLGVTIGFHRLLAHRGFECSRYLKWLGAFWGTAALQGGPIWWVSVHRKHHQVSDGEGDPHSPVNDFWYGHIGWMFQRSGLPQYPALAHDLSQDKFLAWLDRGVNSGIPWFLTLVVCFCIGGVSGVVWGAVVRTLFVWHATWSVNSICHKWGSRPHPTQENSGNVWWVGLWALGEGWHNNHHACPRAAIHGFHWWEIDLSGYVIRLLEKLGLVHKMVRANYKQNRVTPIKDILMPK